MLKKLLSLAVIFNFIQFSLAQNYSEIKDSYLDYFEETREVPYLHLNKTSFLKGENLWFQAYVLDQNSEKLHQQTSNLYVSIYDENGKIKEQQLIHIKNGIGKGNIKIDSSFTKKAYYVRASTKWMKNFKEDNSFSQKIIILKNIDQKEQTVTEKDFFDFQLFPEGGHLLANTYNRIGILIKDANGKGIEIKKGVVKNKNKEEIGTFTTNQFGIGEILLLVKNDEYIFEAVLNDNSTISALAPKVETKGIALNVVNDLVGKKYILKIFTNKSSLENITNKSYSIAVHNTREIKNEIFTFNNKNLSYSFYLDKRDLFNGINIITVFNDKDEPVLERMIFNDLKNIVANKPSIAIQKTQSFDSLKVTFSNNSDKKMYLSASILPENTKAYNASHNITSNFILKPFVKGDIENPSYYFTNTNDETLKNLDLLLLTQGWSKYTWDNIFNYPPKINYNFEKGMDIVLRINQEKNENKSFYLESQENNFSAEVPFNNTTYKLDSTFFFKNSTIKFAIKSGKNFNKVGPMLSFSGNSLYEEVKPNHIKELKNTTPEYTVFPFLEDGYETLNEISLTTESKQEKQRKAAKEKNDLQVFTNRNNRNSVINVNSAGLDFRSETSYYGLPFMYNEYGFYQPGLFGFPPISAELINGPINGDFSQSQNIVTFQPSSFNDNIDQTYVPAYKELYELKLPVGFSKTKEYYSPRYPSINSSSLMEFAAIWWEPNVVIEPMATKEFKIDNMQAGSFLIFYEGINTEGKTIVIKENVSLKKEIE